MSSVGLSEQLEREKATIQEALQEEYDPIEVTMPDEISQLLQADIFTMEGQINDEDLFRYLFYLPEVIRVYDLSLAQLKAWKREEQRRLYRVEHRLMVGMRGRILEALDKSVYTNDDLREAGVVTNSAYQELCELRDKVKVRIDGLQEDIDTLQAPLWKYKNLLKSLDNISKLRISERRF